MENERDGVGSRGRRRGRGAVVSADFRRQLRLLLARQRAAKSSGDVSALKALETEISSLRSRLSPEEQRKFDTIHNQIRREQRRRLLDHERHKRTTRRPTYGRERDNQEDWLVEQDSLVSVEVFLDTDDAVTALRVIGAIQDFCVSLGYSAPIIEDVQRGSVQAWLSAKWNGKEGKAAREASKRLAREAANELEHYGRLRVQDLQADVDGKYVDSVTKLAASFAEEERVAIKVGSILYVKYRDQSNTPVVKCRILSTKELAVLEKSSGILSKPEEVEANLALMVAMEDSDD